MHRGAYLSLFLLHCSLYDPVSSLVERMVTAIPKALGSTFSGLLQMFGQKLRSYNSIRSKVGARRGFQLPGAHVHVSLTKYYHL